jgi:hypothetical protein
MSFLSLYGLITVQAQVMQGLIYSPQGVVVTVVDISQLRLASNSHFLRLRLALLHVVIAVFLDLLEESANHCLLLLAESFQTQLHHLKIRHLFFADFFSLQLLNFCLDCCCLIVLLHFH